MTQRNLQKFISHVKSIVTGFQRTPPKVSHQLDDPNAAVKQPVPESEHAGEKSSLTKTYHRQVTKPLTDQNDKKPSGSSKYDCVMCGKSFPPGDALGRHYRIDKCTEPRSSGESITRVAGTGGIQCPDCNLEFESVNEQRSHRISKH